MPHKQDALPGVLFGQPGPDARRWTFPGGEEDDDSVTLHIVTFAQDGSSRSWSVQVPLVVDDLGELVDGAVQIREES